MIQDFVSHKHMWCRDARLCVSTLRGVHEMCVSIRHQIKKTGIKRAAKFAALRDVVFIFYQYPKISSRVSFFTGPHFSMSACFSFFSEATRQ